MLLELRAENLLLIERAELRLAPGLNVVTGETGAGKTVLAHALDLLLGGRPRHGIVRPGASDAYVEGVFSAPPGLLEGDGLAHLRELLPEELEEDVLARRVSAGGRTRAFVGGRSASAADLRELGARLVSFYGQHEHRRLTVATAQLDALDSFCGPGHLAARRAFAECHARMRELRGGLEALRARVGTRDRDRDLLAFELEEIGAADPSAEDEERLATERERLRHLDALLGASGAMAEALEAEDEGGAASALAEAEGRAADVAGADGSLDEMAERLATVRLEAQELGADLRRYREGLEPEPGRLEEVEERLDVYDRLKRKHGGSVEAVLAHAERCRAELERLENTEVALDEAEAAFAAAAEEEAKRATALTAARERAAPRLAERVLAELSELAMEGASFEVRLERRDELGPAGADRVEFTIAPNIGVPAAPLKETASGGELSRAMLALVGVASAEGGEGRDAPAIVFDEVDAGIGGQTARAVGERLRRLASERQVVCITHLPQIASLAKRHFRIEKRADGDLARAEVEELGENGVVQELCRMLGAEASDPGARRHAEELLAAA